ncbi:MAG: type II toxin-antitoxin system VapC family toxin [Verrucomicrobiales bacterium]
MKRYYDTGTLVKLYTVEPESEAVARFVMDKKQAIAVCELHLSEIAAAFRLKQFRKECSAHQASAALAMVESDLRSGVLVRVSIEWGAVWESTRKLLDKHAAKTGCRTMDTLHLACALALETTEFVTTDRRQAGLATRLGLRVMNPI